MSHSNVIRAAFLATVAMLSVPGPVHAQESDGSGQAPERVEMISYLDSIAGAQLGRRERAVAAIQTQAQAERRRDSTRLEVLDLIGGLPTDRAPLAAKSYGTIQGEGFTIEKVTYESLPGFVVTADLYLPTNVTGPVPAVIITNGHSAAGKVSQYSFAVNFARAGIAALAYDPIGEGERIQYWDSTLDASRVGKATGEHSHAGVQTLLIGDQVARYFIWDAVRGIDYLSSRPEIDSTRIGAFGCSGGGTVTAYLAAIDRRVKAAATACYITSFEALLASPTGPQEGEQSFPFFIERGLDFADWVEMVAPRPYAIVSTTEDMFPFPGARQTYEEAKRIYSLYGVPDHLQWFTGPGPHGALGPESDDIIAFFSHWLDAGRPAPEFAAARPPRPEDLLVTPTGQLASSIGSETVYTLNKKRAASRMAPERKIRDARALSRFRDTLRADVRAVARVDAVPGAAPPHVEVTGQEPRDGYRLESISFPGEGTALDGVLATPDAAGPKKALLMMGSTPLDEVIAPGGDVDGLAREGWVVLFLETPGGKEAMKSPLLGNYYFLASRAMLVGKTVLGIRTGNAIHAIDWLSSLADVDTSRIAGYGIGALGPVILHAAVLDPRIGTIYLEHSLVSYRMGVNGEIHQDLAEVALPGVLLDYDIGGLLMATFPRPVTVIDPVDQMGRPVDEEDFMRDMENVLQSDGALGRPGRIRLLTRGTAGDRG